MPVLLLAGISVLKKADVILLYILLKKFYYNTFYLTQNLQLHNLNFTILTLQGLKQCLYLIININEIYLYT